jgi:hypothetical protein
MRETQVIDADHASGRLSINNDVVTFIELRGNSKVTGGDSIDSMTARDIDLDYTDDGQTLEAVTLAGTAAIAMTGEAGRVAARSARPSISRWRPRRVDPSVSAGRLAGCQPAPMSRSDALRRRRWTQQGSGKD